MAWIFATVFFFLAAVYSPGFRKVVLVVGGALGALAFVARVGEFHQPFSSTITHFSSTITRNSPVKRLTVQPPRRIPTEQIEIGEPRLDFAEGVSSIDLRIQNNSAADTLVGADYTLLIDDCQGTEMEPSHCATISDDKGTIVLEVPPEQARDVTIKAPESYSAVTMLGHPRIRMIITAARARRGVLDRASGGRFAEVIPDAQNGDGKR